MAYTPELSGKSSCTLRRIAWALRQPMTKAIEEVFDYLPSILDNKKVCEFCRDKTRCSDCVFKIPEKGSKRRRVNGSKSHSFPKNAPVD
jgi:recombinational DNA repair protein RecR